MNYTDFAGKITVLLLLPQEEVKSEPLGIFVMVTNFSQN